MRLVLAGGSGHVGSILAEFFSRNGHEVVVLSRGPCALPWPTLPWDGRTLGPWAAALEGAHVVVNLAGHNVNCRYHRRNRERILRSRIDSTQVLGEAIAQCAKPPPTWLQAATATIYAHRYEASNDESTGILGGSEEGAPPAWRFSIDVATAWERTLDAAKTPATRKVKMRSAPIMSPEPGGIFDVLLGLVRRGLGGRAGDGRQYVSWVHHQDFARSVAWLIGHPEIEGAVNIASPRPLPNGEFMGALRDAWGTRWGLPASKWMLELGALFLRTETELVLKSRRVVPGVLLEQGFSFRYPSWPRAAADLCREWRAMRGRAQAAPEPREVSP